MRYIGDYTAKAEAYACAGRVGNTGVAVLPSECSAIQRFIDAVLWENKPNDPVILNKPRDSRVIGNFLIRLIDMSGVNTPRWHSGRAGLWLGYSVGTCRLSIKYQQDNRLTLIDHLRAAKNHLLQVDPTAANMVDAIIAEAALNPPPYSKISNMIYQLEMRPAFHPLWEMY